MNLYGSKLRTKGIFSEETAGQKEEKAASDIDEQKGKAGDGYAIPSFVFLHDKREDGII